MEPPIWIVALFILLLVATAVWALIVANR